MIRLARPAPIELRRDAPLYTLAQMLALLPPRALKGAPPPELAARHIARTRNWGAWVDGECVAAGGLSDRAASELEAWFACLPSASRHIVSIVAQTRLTLRLIAETEAVEIRARVALGWRPGQRLAAALGFARTGEEFGFEIWTMGRG